MSLLFIYETFLSLLHMFVYLLWLPGWCFYGIPVHLFFFLMPILSRGEGDSEFLTLAEMLIVVSVFWGGRIILV